MLMTEWNMDDALAVRYVEGQENEREKIARNALAKDIPLETIHEITGLDLETIRKLQEL